MKIPDKTKVQSIDLRVKDLKTSLNFYSNQLGLKEIERSNNTSFLSADGKYPYIIKLAEDKSSPVRKIGTTGLFHLALRFPNRKELAKVFIRLFNNKIKFQGFSDHLVSEAVYLADPDGNGIELYTDRPKEEWEWKLGEVKMDSLPLDLSILTKELDYNEDRNEIHPETDLGHVHLNVSDLLNAEKFYSNLLGFDVTNFSYPGARFFSAGGYHHHIGTNTWQTKKVVSRNDDSLGLIDLTLKIPDKDFIKAVEKNAGESNLLLKSDGEEVLIKDYDDNKVRLVL